MSMYFSQIYKFCIMHFFNCVKMNISLVKVIYNYGRTTIITLPAFWRNLHSIENWMNETMNYLLCAIP